MRECVLSRTFCVKKAFPALIQQNNNRITNNNRARTSVIWSGIDFTGVSTTQKTDTLLTQAAFRYISNIACVPKENHM